MTAPRISFDRPDEQACDVCGGSPPAQTGPTPIALVDPPVELALCDACRARLTADGTPPPPFVPEFRFDGALRVPIVTADDLGVLLRAVASAAAGRPVDRQQGTLLERAGPARLAEHEAWAARVARAGRRPDPVDVAGLLVTAALLDLEPEPVDALRDLVGRAAGPDELGVCFGAYCARSAGVRRWRPHGPPPVGRARRLLEEADRALLFATLPARHVLAERAAQIRLAVLIVLRREQAADAQLLRLGEDDPRSQLLRSLRFLQKDHLGAADRDLRAAGSNPFAGFDPEIDAATIWNRTVRALDATRVGEAVDALRAYCRLQPDDAEARIVLGHAYVQAARDPVAREVLGSVLDDEAVTHLRALSEAGELDAEARTQGRLLHASCVLRLGDARAARRILEPELDADPETATRRAEVLRLAARCALDLGQPEPALDLLGQAFALDRSPPVAREAAWAAGRAVRDRLELHGLPGLFELVDRRPWLGDALRRHYGTAHTFLGASYALHQVRGGFRPQSSFGLDWSWIGTRGANAQTSTFQAYASLARHQVATGLQHDLAAQAASGAPIPCATLAALFAAARGAPRDQVDELQRLLAEIARRALRDLDPSR